MATKCVETWKAFGDEIRENLSKLLVVFFCCKDCELSNQLAPVIDELASQYSDVVFLKVDIDDAKEVAGYCGIAKTTPVFHFYNKGKKEKDLITPTADELKKKVQDLMQ